MDYNWAADISSTKTSGGSYSGRYGSGSGYGTASNVFDNDITTLYYWRGGVTFGALVYGYSATVTLWAESDFEDSYNISKIVSITSDTGSIGEGGGVVSNCKIKAYYNSSWNTLSDTNPGNTILDSLGLVNVTKVRLEMTVVASVNYGRQMWAQANAYELQAWGTRYHDIGLRIKSAYGAGIISIGARELESNDQLRIRKGNTTYGIPLLDTDSPFATPIRIYDGTNIKALPGVN